MAPLLPKLRGHFAEFLNDTSSAGLRILSSSTCVGLRYGYGANDSGFSRHLRHGLPYFYFGPLSNHAFHSWLPLKRCVPAVLSHRSTGISTCRPSATALALVLGPDFPRADQLHSGNLGYSAWRILTSISLLIPAFSLPIHPRALIGRASSVWQCSSTNVVRHSRASAACLSPGYFRRRTSRLVSYYALFE